jgi:hypothetical protein
MIRSPVFEESLHRAGFKRAKTRRHRLKPRRWILAVKKPE